MKHTLETKQRLSASLQAYWKSARGLARLPELSAAMSRAATKKWNSLSDADKADRIKRLGGSRVRKLTDGQAEEIRTSAETIQELVDRFGVSRATVSNIRRGASYR